MQDHSPRVFRSSSFERKQKVIREEVMKKYGSVESVLELGGTVRDGNVIVTDCLIPEAELYYSSFKVKDQSLSKCWSQADKSPSTVHLSPIGDLHYHPEMGSSVGKHSGPSASSVDEANSLRLAGLYHVFNQEEIVSECTHEGRMSSDKEACLEYVLDPFTWVHIPGKNAEGSLPIVVRRKEIRSFWASLIRTADGNPEHDRSYVIEHSYAAGRQEEPKITRYKDVPSVVVSDEEASHLTGWPLDKIRLDIDRKELALEVSEKYRTCSGSRRGTNHYGDYYEACGGSTLCPVYDYGGYGLTYQGYYWYYGLPSHGDCSHSREEFIYLRGDASPDEIAALLREVATLLETDKPSQSDPHYLAESKPVEMLRALRECCLLIDRSSKQHDRH